MSYEVSLENKVAEAIDYFGKDFGIWEGTSRMELKALGERLRIPVRSAHSNELLDGMNKVAVAVVDPLPVDGDQEKMWEATMQVMLLTYAGDDLVDECGEFSGSEKPGPVHFTRSLFLQKLFNACGRRDEVVKFVNGEGEASEISEKLDEVLVHVTCFKFESSDTVLITDQKARLFTLRYKVAYSLRG